MFFLPIWLFLKAYRDFLTDEVTPKMTFWATFDKNFFYVFTLIISFKTWFVVDVFLGFKSSTMWVFCTLKYSFNVDFFVSVAVLATLFQIFGNFFKTSIHTLQI